MLHLGFVIGWISLFVDFIGFISSVTSFLALSIFGCDSIEKVVNSSKIRYAGDFWKDCEKGRGSKYDQGYRKTDFNIYLTVLIGLLLLSTLITAAFVFFSWLLIKGTHNVNHSGSVGHYID